MTLLRSKKRTECGDEISRFKSLSFQVPNPTYLCIPQKKTVQFALKKAPFSFNKAIINTKHYF